MQASVENFHKSDLKKMNSLLWESVLLQEAIYNTLPFGIAIWHCQNKSSQDIDIVVSSCNTIAKKILQNIQLGALLDQQKFSALHQKITDCFTTKTATDLQILLMGPNEDLKIYTKTMPLFKNYVCTHFFQFDGILPETGILAGNLIGEKIVKQEDTIKVEADIFLNLDSVDTIQLEKDICLEAATYDNDYPSNSKKRKKKHDIIDLSATINFKKKEPAVILPASKSSKGNKGCDHRKQQDTDAPTLDTILESNPCAISVINREGKIVVANTAFKTLFGYENILDHNISSLSHPEDLPSSRVLTQQIWKGELKEFSFLKKYINSKGEVFWGLLICSPCIQPDSTVDYITCTLLEYEQFRNRFPSMFA
jgi:PAS domain S-box-containing protein